MSNTHNNKQEKTFTIKDMEPEQLMKYEIAKELGLYDKVVNEGWKSLSARESGKIGGMISSKLKSIKATDNNQ